MESRMRTAVAATAFILIHSIIKKKKRRPRRWWQKEIYRKRLQYGNRLMEDMAVECIEDSVKNFSRMSPTDFQNLCSLLEPRIKKNDTYMRDAITVKERLAITLRFLATGDSFTSLQYLFRVSKQTISTTIPEVCDAIIESLKDYVKVPSSEEEWLAIAKQFEERWNFPHVIGAIDGKHVVLQAPMNSGTEYFNYKSFFSIVLFALVDANYNFLYVDVGCQGRISDGGVFKNSNLHKKLDSNTLNIPAPQILQIPYAVEVPYMLLADKAFALNKFTMRPFEGAPERGSIERIFNYRLSRGRRVTENAFGLLSSVYRVLRKPMLLEPEKARKVVLATIYLHNFLRKRANSAKLYTLPGSLDSNENEGVVGTWRIEQPMSSLLPMQHIPRRSTNDAKRIRLHLARHFVTNGTIPWQNIYQ